MAINNTVENINNQPTIEPRTVTGIFTKYIAKTIPLAFDESMSYYECLCALLEYLNDTIVPDINNVNDGLSELQTFYLQLQSYVNDYFENLDVQDEINNKLDEMVESGEIANLIQVILKQETDKLDNELNEFEELINSQMATLDNKVNVATSSTPLVASSTSDMTETDRIYVNTTNGHWYYYDNDQWNDAGLYQSTGISDESITIFNLDDKLQSEFIKDYENVDINFQYQGYCEDSSGTFVINQSNTDFNYGYYNLTNGSEYEFSGFNAYNVTGLVVVDTTNDNEIVASTRSQSGTSDATTRVSLRFKANKSGLRAYVTIGSSTGYISEFYKKAVFLNEFKDIVQNYKEYTLTPLYTITGGILTYNSTLGGNIDLEPSGDNNIIIVYKMNKGCKYRAIGNQRWSISAVILSNNKLTCLYKSASSSSSSAVPVDYTFTATQDGYIFLTQRDGTQSSLHLYSALEIAKNDYANKTWCLMGDSLTDRSSLGSSVDIYEDYCKEKLGITTINYGHGGSGYLARVANNQAFFQIANTLSNPDVITIFGSFNDTYTTLSTYGWGETTDHNTNTIFGAMNTTFDNIIENYPNAVLGVIIPTPWKDRNSYDTTTENMEKAEKYVNGLIEICERRSIPYLNLYIDSNLYPWDETFRETFFLNGDGTHPNTKGHKKFSGQIEQFIRRLLI